MYSSSVEKYILESMEIMKITLIYHTAMVSTKKKNENKLECQGFTFMSVGKRQKFLDKDHSEIHSFPKDFIGCQGLIPAIGKEK